MNGHVTKKGERYYVVLELGVDPTTGKRRRKWHSGYERKADAKEALAKLVTDLHQGSYVAPSKETFAQYLERWLPTIRSTVRANTFEAYRSSVEVHLIPGLGSIPLKQLDRTVFSTYYEELSRTGRSDGRGGLGPRSIRAIHVAAHKALKDAVKDNLLVRNPTDDAAVPKKKRSDTPSWTAEDLAVFFGSTAGHRLHASFWTLAHTGLRRSELLGLRWSHVDLEAGTLVVRQVVSLDKYKPFIAEPKTAKARRVVSLDSGTVKVLRSHRVAQFAERLKAGEAWQNLDLVFCREDGSILHPQTISGAFARAAVKAKLPAIGIHGLRHSHASVGLAAGIPLVIMSERLGHSSIAITGDVYSHSLPAQHQAAADAIASLISS